MIQDQSESNSERGKDKNFYLSEEAGLTLSLSLSLSHTHTHTLYSLFFIYHAVMLNVFYRK